MIFKRKIYDRMLEWKKTVAGRKALLIEGARRVGKTTIVKEFAEKEYESYIFIDFMYAGSELTGLFRDLSDLDYFFMQLQLICGVTLIRRKSLIIFDEVQACPLARQAIKRLALDGRYDYIETGSYISIKNSVKSITIPSEELRISMYPMDFEEFLWAVKKDFTSMNILRDAYMSSVPIGESANQKKMKEFRLYVAIGGMPEAVSKYLETNDLMSVDKVKREIIAIYKDDFRKIDSTNRSSDMFSAIPSQLSSNASRYMVSSVVKNQRAQDVSEVVANMKDSKTVLVSYNVTDPSVGLAGTKNMNFFKMYLSDTGLFTTLMFYDRDFTDNTIYKKLIGGRLPANLGYLYENAVAQMLTASGYELYYHTWLKPESTHRYEIDFLIAHNWKICPIEVKSSGYKTHESFDEFCVKYSHQLENRYIVYSKDFAKEGAVTYLPFYMVPFI